jgi:hypothetical protein
MALSFGSVVFYYYFYIMKQKARYPQRYRKVDSDLPYIFLTQQKKIVNNFL